jgi:Leucine-rich repeat (LRR) protein
LGWDSRSGRLTSIDASNNRLTWLPKINSSAVRVLWFHFNLIAEIPASSSGFFSGTPMVMSISLHHNLITQIGLGVFNGLPALQILQLHNNQMVRFAPVAPPTRGSPFDLPAYSPFMGSSGR